MPPQGNLAFIYYRFSKKENRKKVKCHAVFKAVRDAMPDPLAGGGPFELSMPGKLEELFAEAGLKVLASGEADCQFSYPDFETFGQANSSAGPFQAMLRIVGEEQLKAAIRDAVQAFRLADSSILIQPNVFKYVVAAVGASVEVFGQVN